jgi:hypothetical protein
MNRDCEKGGEVGEVLPCCPVEEWTLSDSMELICYGAIGTHHE